MPSGAEGPGGADETSPTGQVPAVTGTLVTATGTGTTARPVTEPRPDAVPATPAMVRLRPGTAVGWRRADVLWAAAAFCCYAFLAVGVFWHIWTGHPTTETIGGADSYMDSWFLAFVAQAVVHGHNPFFTVFGNYPYGIDVLDQSSQPFLGLVGTPVTLVFGALATFNLWVTAGLALSAMSAYALARRFVRWHPAAFLAGLVYGFSPYAIVQAADGHLNISFVAVPPLVFLVLHDALVARRDRWVRNGFLLAVLLVVQFFISDEVLITTVVVGTVAVVVGALVGHRAVRTALPGAAKALVLGAVVTAAALALPVRAALRGPGHIVGPIQPVAEAYRADLLGPLLPTQMERWAPSGWVQVAMHFAGSSGENGSYLGFPLVALLALGVVWLWRDRVVRVLAITGLVAFVLSLGGALTVTGEPAIGRNGNAVGRLPLPEALLHDLGPLRSLIPVRISLYVALAAGVLAAVVLDRLRTGLAIRWSTGGTGSRAVAFRRVRWARRLAGGTAVVAGLVVLGPLVPVAPFASAAPVGIPAYFTRSHAEIGGRDTVGLVYPYPSEKFAQAEAWQAYAGLPFEMPGGYFLVPGPSGAVSDTPVMAYTRTTQVGLALTELWAGKPQPETPTWRTNLRSELATWHVRTVVAVPQDGADPAGALAYLEWLLGPPSARQGGTVDWYGLRWGR